MQNRGVHLKSIRGGLLSVAWMTMFVIGTDLFVMSPLLPMVAASHQVSASTAGFSVTVFSLVYMLSAPLFGHFSDRLGRAVILTCGIAAFAAANLVTALAPSFSWLLIARIGAGAAAAAVSPSIYALIGESAPANRQGT